MREDEDGYARRGGDGSYICQSCGNRSATTGGHATLDGLWECRRKNGQADFDADIGQRVYTQLPPITADEILDLDGLTDSDWSEATREIARKVAL